MIPVLIAAAMLSVLCIGWTFRPVKTPRAFYALSFLCAILALGLYLVLGRPDLAAQPIGKAAIAERAEFMKQEFEFMGRLEKNPDDADAMIRLAAIHVLQHRHNDETIKMLDRAETLLPGDNRIKFIRGMIKNPVPDGQ